VSVEFLRTRFPDREWEDRGGGLWRARELGGGWRYVLIDGDLHCVTPGGGGGWPDDPGFEAEIRRAAADEIAYQRLPTCVVPDCDQKAPMVFRAAERGRLAGQEWQRGQEIRTCPEHGNDIYQAQGVRGVDRLAEWLRPDARLDPLDEYEADYDALHGREIADSRARALRAAIQAGGRFRALP
jgi:hypothetical protein